MGQPTKGQGIIILFTSTGVTPSASFSMKGPIQVQGGGTVATAGVLTLQALDPEGTFQPVWPEGAAAAITLDMTVAAITAEALVFSPSDFHTTYRLLPTTTITGTPAYRVWIRGGQLLGTQPSGLFDTV